MIFPVVPKRQRTTVAEITRHRVTNPHLPRTLAPVQKAEFTLLLSHRPELFTAYAGHKVRPALSGYAHGGRVRLSRVGGGGTPGHGPLPPFDAGVFRTGRTSIVVRHELGRSAFPWRLNNPLEIVSVKPARDEAGNADAV